MEKKINGNDIYYLQVIGDRIIINDNYEGIIIFDYKINMLKKIKIYEGIYIYSSFIIGENELILFCPEDNNVVYVDIEKSEVKIMEVENDILSSIIFNSMDKCVFHTNKNKYIIFDKKKKELKKVNSNNEFNENMKENQISKIENRILKMHEGCNNEDYKDDVSVITYEDKIIIYNNGNAVEQYPREGYIFNNAKIMQIYENLYLVVLCNKKNDEDISILSVKKINSIS